MVLFHTSVPADSPESEEQQQQVEALMAGWSPSPTDLHADATKLPRLGQFQAEALA